MKDERRKIKNMWNKISGAGKAAIIFAIAIVAVTLSVLLLTGRSGRSDSEPLAAATPTRATTPSPAATPSETERRSAFFERSEEFTKLPAKVKLTAEPYIKGKAAFYSYDVGLDKPKTDWWLDNNLGGRPSYSDDNDKAILDVTAQTPDEVETVVLRKCKQVRQGSYTVSDTNQSIPAYPWSCDLTIVDRTIPAVIFRKNFESEMPLFEMADAKEDKVLGALPKKEINTFLGSLPRK